jgi:hypothetical protein
MAANTWDEQGMRDTGMISLRFNTPATLLLTLVWLSGCGPQSVANLRKKPHNMHSFEVPVDCETTYDRIALRARQRYRVIPMAAHQPGVSAKLAESRQSATVSLWDSGRIGIRYILTADLRRTDSSQTQVNVYYATKADLTEARLWEQWANMPLER